MRDIDIVSDIISRLTDSIGADMVPPQVLTRLEAEIRRDWAGDTVYVRGDRCRIRNEEIRRRWRSGVTIDRLSAAFGLSERRIRQIINTRRKK